MRPLQIAFLVSYFPKLSEIFILNQALALEARGHRVTFFALRDPQEAVKQPGAEQFVEAGRVEVAEMPKGASRFARAFSVASQVGWGSALRSLNVFRYGVEALTLHNLYRLRVAGERLDEFDVVHAQFGNVARQAVCLRRSGLLKRPLVTAFRGNDLSGYLRFGTSKLYGSVFRESGACLPVSRRWVDTLAEMGCPREQIHPMPSGVPMAAIPERRQWRNGSRRDAPRVVTAARLDRYKGVQYGLEAFAGIRERYPGATYRVLGEGPERAALERRAAELGLSESCEFLGQIPHERVIEELGKSHLHLFTTVTLSGGRTEGVPNILKESQAAGVPVVAFNHPGVDEVIDDEETGFLVAEKDVGAMVERSVELLASDDRGEQLSARGQERARARFDIGALTEELEQIYRGLL